MYRIRKQQSWGFPGGPVVRNRGFHFGGLDSVPGRGTKIRQAMHEKTKQKQKTQQQSYLFF